MRHRVYVIPITLITLLIVLILSGVGTAANGLISQSDLKIESVLLKLTELPEDKSRIWASENDIELGNAPGSFKAIVETSEHISTQRLSQVLRSNGAYVEAIGSRVLRAEIPVERAVEIARLSEVGYVRRPLVHRALSAPTQNRGVLETGGSMMHAHQFRGGDVVIAIIDNGFEGLTGAKSRDLLPADSVIDFINYEDEIENDSSHGLEVARFAYDMAPDAKFVLMNIGDEVDLENAVDDAIRMGVDVINHSIGWFNSNFGDGTGLIDELVGRAKAAGILWVNAAGNQAASHWMGSSIDADGDGWIEFAPGVDGLEIAMQFPGQIDLVFVWDDFPKTREDYDLYLTDWQDNIIASAEERQTGAAPPSEELQHFVEQPGLYKIKVRAHKISNRPMGLKIFVMDQVIDPAVPEGSVVAPADCSCALAVGAIGIKDWELGFIEFFSARGPTSDGRIKPDLVGPDGIRGLNGTSFSSPHVAGAAALLLSQDPSRTVDDLMRLLTEQTFDIYAPGKDNITGFGKLEMRLAFPDAQRSLSQAQLRIGETAIATIEATMPALQFGRFELSERVPAAFDVEVTDADGGQSWIERTPTHLIIHWIRELLAPGDRVAFQYQLTAREGSTLGPYQIDGMLNERPVSGDARLVLAPSERLFTSSNSARLVTPVVGSLAIRFLVSPLAQQATSEVRVQVLNLNGEPISDSGWISPQRVTMMIGREWSSGVYLYLFSARDPVGNITERSLQKFHILAK